MADARASGSMQVGNDSYILGDKLGYGAFSWAVLATKVSTNEVVALKFTQHNEQGSDRAKKRQQQEINTELDVFTKVKHENVVALHGYDPDVEYEHDSGKRTRCFCMALECCEGGELFDIVYYTGKLEEKLARTLFFQIVSGLAAMHKVGLCHRDIKPQNILLTSRFQVKIADFGSSKMFNRQELMKTFRVGTKGYQAPEVLLRRGYTLKCDIFSTGVLLFVILTKHPPFRQAVSEDQWFRQIAKKQFAQFWAKHPKDKLSRACRDLICKMLCYQPLDRLTIQGVLAHPWTQMDVYAPSQMLKIMRAKKKNATNGRLNDDARCPLKYNSEKMRAGEFNEDWIKPLPEHLSFRALVSKEMPWKPINYLMSEMAQGSNKACVGTLFEQEVRLELKATTTYGLGFEVDGVEQKETETIVIHITGYKDAEDDKKFYLDIAIKSGYSEASQQFYNKILSLLNMDFKPNENNEEEALELDEIAGDMTEEEKKTMADRKAKTQAIMAALGQEELDKIAADVIGDSEKKKKKKKKAKQQDAAEEEEVAAASS